MKGDTLERVSPAASPGPWSPAAGRDARQDQRGARDGRRDQRGTVPGTARGGEGGCRRRPREH